MSDICLIGQHRLSGAPESRDALLLIAGPCALESYDLARHVAETMQETCAGLGIHYIFKASFDKANRSSIRSPRGPGIEKGLEELDRLRSELDVPVTTDFHLPEQAEQVASVVDLLQVPAFLCRQTDMLVAAGEAAQKHKCAVSVKKGQFLSPGEMQGPIRKLSEAGCENILLIERGTFFGYHRLINDFVGMGDLMELGPPVCFDVTHSTQLPGATETSGGRPDRAPLLARAAVAAGVPALFMETHPDPPSALSDASNMLPLDDMPALLKTLQGLREVVAGV